MTKNNKQNKTIDELVREERLAYFKEWREKNKDKVKKHNTDYWRKRVLKKQGGSVDNDI